MGAGQGRLGATMQQANAGYGRSMGQDDGKGKGGRPEGDSVADSDVFNFVRDGVHYLDCVVRYFAIEFENIGFCADRFG